MKPVVFDINPFVYERPLPPEQIIDREDETHRLVQLADGGHFVRIYAPRRYGKTSLLKKVLLEAERQADMVVALVDLYGVLNLSDVAIRLERAYARSLKGPVRSQVDALLQATGLGISLGGFGLSVKLQADPRTDALPALHALLDLPERVMQKTNRRVLVAFDEFQDVLKVPGLDALLRSHIQHHGDVAAYMFAGSEPGMMTELFDDKARPLYGQAEPMRLGRLEDGHIAEYVSARFAETGRDAADVPGLLTRTAAGHPQRAMLLAHRLWDLVERGTVADEESWLTARDAALRQTNPEFDALWRHLDANEQRTLRAIAQFGSPYVKDAAAALNLPKTNAQKAVPRLLARAEIEHDEQGFRFVDPFLELWLQSRVGDT